MQSLLRQADGPMSASYTQEPESLDEEQIDDEIAIDPDDPMYHVGPAAGAATLYGRKGSVATTSSDTSIRVRSSLPPPVDSRPATATSMASSMQSDNLYYEASS